MTTSTLDYGELANDLDFVTKSDNLAKSLEDIKAHMKKMEAVDYEKLDTEDQLKYDIFRSYALNSLFWMYLKLNGKDPAEHGITHELARIKEVMKKEKELQDKNKMPRVDQKAARRFVKHELWTPKNKKDGMIPSGSSSSQPVNRKRKFED